MSGVLLSDTHKAAEATVDADGKIRYTVYYRVRMSSAGDGPQQVLQYLESRGISWGISYDFANDNDVGTFCDGITVRRVSGSTTEWDATVNYGPPTRRQDDDGNPSDNPPDWRWTVDMGYATWQEPCWKAINLTDFPHPYQVLSPTGGSFVRPYGTYGPVVNSANVPLNPTLMRDVFDTVIRITAYSLYCDMNYPYDFMGSINAAEVQWSDYIRAVHNLSSHRFPTYTLKCTDASAAAKVYEQKQSGVLIRIPYWEWNWEFRYRAGTWIEEVLDQGVTSLPDEEMLPDGVTFGIDIDEGTAPHMPVMDLDNQRIPELVNFDGKGYPMLPLDAHWEDGYFFRWRKDSTMSFAYPDLPFNFFSAVT